MLPIMLVKSKGNLKAIPKNLGPLIPIGLFGTLTVISQMLAINLTLVAYVISIKRTSAVMSVVFGYLIFKERGFKEKLTGAPSLWWLGSSLLHYCKLTSEETVS